MSRIVWVYWVSRDSLDGVLSGVCDLWYEQPVRVAHRNRVTWVPAAPTPSNLGQYVPADITGWFGVYPETDLELIRAEQHPTEQMIKESRRGR